MQQRDRIGSDAVGDGRARDRRESRSSTAAPMLIVGSAILIVASFLDWIDSRNEAAGAANGFQIPDGRVVLGIGAALLVIGVLMAKNRRVGSWFDADLLGTALSTVALVNVVALWIYLGSDERSPDIGLYAAAVGAAIAMFGALSAALRSGSDRLTADDEGRGDIGRGDRR